MKLPRFDTFFGTDIKYDLVFCLIPVHSFVHRNGIWFTALLYTVVSFVLVQNAHRHIENGNGVWMDKDVILCALAAIGML